MWLDIDRSYVKASEIIEVSARANWHIAVEGITNETPNQSILIVEVCLFTKNKEYKVSAKTNVKRCDFYTYGELSTFGKTYRKTWFEINGKKENEEYVFIEYEEGDEFLRMCEKMQLLSSVAEKEMIFDWLKKIEEVMS